MERLVSEKDLVTAAAARARLERERAKWSEATIRMEAGLWDVMFAPGVETFWLDSDAQLLEDPFGDIEVAGLIVAPDSPVYGVVRDALILGADFHHGGYEGCYLRGEYIHGGIVWAPYHPWWRSYSLPMEEIMKGIDPPVGRVASDEAELDAVMAAATPVFFVPHCTFSSCPGAPKYEEQLCRGLPTSHRSASGRSGWELGTHGGRLQVMRPGGLAANAWLRRWQDPDEDAPGAGQLVVEELAIVTEGPAAARPRHLWAMIRMLECVCLPYGQDDVAFVGGACCSWHEALEGLGLPEALDWLKELDEEDSVRGVLGAPRLA